MEKLYMLSIDDRDNLNNRIKIIKESLKDINYRLWVTSKSIAVYLEEEEDNKYSDGSGIIENNESKECKKAEEVKERYLKQEDMATEYRNFIYNMKSIARGIKTIKL